MGIANMALAEPALGITTGPAEGTSTVRLASGEPDWVADEAPIALVYNGVSHAVMMATPLFLEEFALGFTVSEGIVPDSSLVYGVEVHKACGGYAAEVTIDSESFWRLKERRRSMTGRTGCGLCGVESLEAAVRRAKPVPFTQTFDMARYEECLRALDTPGEVGVLTGCTHSAMWADSQGKPVLSAEDVGRHVALDKLLGMRIRRGARDGALFVSSRASFEMVQKAACCGVEIMFAVSAPTALAVDLARKSGMTLSGFCRRRRINVYTHPERLKGL